MVMPKKVCRQETLKCRQVAKRIIKSAKKRGTISAYEARVLSEVTVWCVDQRCGKAYQSSGLVTIPLWSLSEKKGKGYFGYYVAHELSHMLAKKRYGERDHCVDFYRCFVDVCPSAVQKYEYDYQKRSPKKMRLARRMNKENPGRFDNSSGMVMFGKRIS